jgi:capsular polysaccharide transport system permease protein
MMPFLPALESQERVLGAILRREINEQLHRGGYRLILGVLEPLLVLSIAIIWHTLLAVRPGYGNSRVLFLSTGLYPTFIFVHLSAQFRHVSKGSSGARNFPLEKTLDLVLASAFMKLAMYYFGGVLGFGLIYCCFTPEAWPSNWTALLAGLAALALLGLGMGLCNAVIEQLLPLWPYIWNPVARGLILFSGVIYVPDFLPVHIRNALSWNPVLQGVELLRRGFYPGYPTACARPLYLWTVIGVLLLAGLCAHRVFRRRLNAT